MTAQIQTPVGFPKCTVGVRGLPKWVIQGMYADWRAGGSFAAVGRKWNGRTGGTIRTILLDHGLVKPDAERSRRVALYKRKSTGRFAKGRRATAAEIERLLAKATRVCVPRELASEWRHWPMVRRVELIERLRARLVPAFRQRPRLPFSAGLEPFDYGSARAHALAKRLNAGRDSRSKAVQLRPVCQGVIYKERFYFWVADSVGRPHGSYYTGTYPRRALHWVIWEEHHGPVPKHHVVRFKDGNPNNFEASNLELKYRGDLARENIAMVRMKKARTMTAALLKRFQRGTNANDTIERLKERSRCGGGAAHCSPG